MKRFENCMFGMVIGLLLLILFSGCDIPYQYQLLTLAILGAGALAGGNR